MQDFFTHFDALRRENRTVALATVIGVTEGSSKRLGARMWVTGDRRVLGSLTVGGCVDARAREESQRVLSDGRSRRIRIDLADEGPEFGMSCAGTVEVFIEKVVPATAARMIEAVQSETADGRMAVLVTPLDDSPERPVISRTDRKRGPLRLDPAANGNGRRSVCEGPSRIVGGAVTAAVESLLEEDEEGCAVVSGEGERPDVFLQSFLPTRVLAVVGASPIADPLVRLGKLLGFRVVMIDGSSERLTRERFPDADELLAGIPSEICGTLGLGTRDGVVLTAHDYRYEVPVLKEVLRHPVGYVGFVASRRRGRAVLEFLADSGVDARALDRVRVPVGLDVGALTPAEIAVSIAGEMLALRSGRNGGPLKDGDPDARRPETAPETLQLRS